LERQGWLFFSFSLIKIASLIMSLLMFARCIIAAIVSEYIERIAHVLWVLCAVQMVLMSGLSRTALEDLASDKFFEDRIPHICNILKFAVLKKDHSFMAIGGSWDPTDGMDPSVDQSSLIQTMLRFVSSRILLSFFAAVLFIV
jgi:hypothetical protein